MQKSLMLLLALTAVSATVKAQTAGADLSNSTQAQAAPVVRSYPGQAPAIASSRPVAGVWLRTEANSAVQTLSANADGMEIRIEHGRANIDVHHPAGKSQLLVDLPGGQVALVKDGLYTFNADTNTVRVLHGEAAGYPGSTVKADTKPIKVKEDHELTLAGTGDLRAVSADPHMLGSDLLPGGYAPGGYARGYGYAGASYGDGFYGPYGDGFYGGPYVAYGYGWGYPGWGYPYGGGLGFGYYGGFRGGFGGRGGFRR